MMSDSIIQNNDNFVGSDILNIVTKSLYDEPIVVFREYVQNSSDAIERAKNDVEDVATLRCNIWLNDQNLYFLDNGTGIEQDEFENVMERLADSTKNRKKDIGYKGIGRFSGLPYCDTLKFINIINFDNNEFMEYKISSIEHKKLIDEYQDKKHSLTFEQLMKRIGSYSEKINEENVEKIKKEIEENADIFKDRNVGFLVKLENINSVLSKAIKGSKKESFMTTLGWLLPVPFKESLLEEKTPINDFTIQDKDSDIIPAKSYNVYYSNEKVERPITPDMTRNYIYKIDFDVAVGFQSFSDSGIAIDNSNSFSGIRIYINNVLLCDESELIPMLDKYELLNHSVNEMLQTVKGIGAIIYITNKVFITANARRTFIEIEDGASFDFLKQIASYIEKIYKARYSISDYYSNAKKIDVDEKKLEALYAKASKYITELADEKILVPQYKEPENPDATEQKRIIRNKINAYLSDKVKNYIKANPEYDPDNIIENFLIWFDDNR